VYDPLDIDAQRDKRREKQKALTINREQEEADIRWLMGQKAGRRFINRLLALSGVYRSSFTGNSETFFREGMCNVGLMVLADVQRLTPEEFVTMLKEHSNDGHDSSSDRAK
jgi:hypothetical protein